MNSVPEQAQPIATVAAELDIPLTTLRYWITKDGLQTDMRKQGRTRALYLPADTINALRARKQLPQEPIGEPVEETEAPTVPALPPFPLEIKLSPLPAQTEAETVVSVKIQPRRKAIGRKIVHVIFYVALKVLRLILALHTSKSTADWIVGPIVYESQSMRPMKLRRR